nr:hypothetical protein [Acrocarpospora macrocephala]
MVQEPVEDRGGQDLVGEDLSPLAEGLVAGDDDRALLVAAGYELEDEVGVGSIQGQIADLIDLCGYPHRSTYADTATMPRIPSG